MQREHHEARWARLRAAAYERDSQAIVTMPDGSVEVGARCWICGGRIDYAAPARTRYAYEPDHFLPASLHPELAYDLGNLRPAHSSCNRKRGDGRARKPKQGDLGNPSREW